MVAGKPLNILFLWAAVLVALASIGCGSGEGARKTIVLYGFSAMENVMKEEVIPEFRRYWKRETGQDVRVITSFAGSGTITNQIVFGAPAQVGMVATEMDAFNMKRAGLVTTDWRSFRNKGTYAYSIACIVVRKGNPKGIRSFEDLTGHGTEVMYPDPTTSGGAQWAILALYGAALKAGESSAEGANREDAKALLKLVSSNAGSLPESSRRASTQFGLGYGDVLLTYENEALLDISKGKEYEIVVPMSTIYIEPKVVIVDRNVDEAEKEVVRAFVDVLWTEGVQEALAMHNFRVWDDSIAEKYSDRYEAVELPFTVDYLGGWKEATSSIIDRTWRQVQREIN